MTRSPTNAMYRRQKGWNIEQIQRALVRAHDSGTGEFNVLAIIKGREIYVFAYEDSQWSEAMRCIERSAIDPKLNFSWNDAAELSQRIRWSRSRDDGCAGR